jgi:hypothetical protein
MTLCRTLARTAFVHLLAAGAIAARAEITVTLTSPRKAWGLLHSPFGQGGRLCEAYPESQPRRRRPGREPAGTRTRWWQPSARRWTRTAESSGTWGVRVA